MAPRLPAPPRRVAAVPGGGGGSHFSRTLGLVVLALSVFMIGIVVGMAFVDARASLEAERRPGAGLTQERLRLPPGLRRKADIVALEAASAAAEASVPEPVSVDAPSPEKQPPPPPSPEVPAAPLPLPTPALYAELYADARPTDLVEIAAPVDAPEMSFGAWIYVDGSRSLRTIRMIASNRNSGCAVDAAHAGFSFHVNNWDTADAALVLEWQHSAGGGCARLSSEPGTILLDTWVHAAFAFRRGRDGAPGEAMLFLNGELLRTGPAARAAGDISGANLVLGVSTDGQFPFAGGGGGGPCSSCVDRGSNALPPGACRPYRVRVCDALGRDAAAAAVDGAAGRPDCLGRGGGCGPGQAAPVAAPSPGEQQRVGGRLA